MKQVTSAANPHYQALGKQNCAGVALMGLKEGGAEAFVTCPQIKVCGEPVQVETYANHLAMQLERMEEWTRQLDADIARGVVSGVVKPAASDNLVDGLWKPETWKKESALGTFKVRSSAIRDIDHGRGVPRARLEGELRRAVCRARHAVPRGRQAPAGQGRERTFGIGAAARRADPGHHAQSRTDLVAHRAGNRPAFETSFPE